MNNSININKPDEMKQKNDNMTLPKVIQYSPTSSQKVKDELQEKGRDYGRSIKHGEIITIEIKGAEK